MSENVSKGSEEHRNYNAEKLKELTDKLEDGVRGVRDSAEFKALLKTMAKFPRYSLNNCILIGMQRPDATLCQSYGGWKKMGRYVKKGEKGIRVIAPAPYTIEKEVDKLDDNGKVILDKDGEPVKVKQELNLMSYKVESTFDISQTDGKELPRVGIDELEGSVDKYQLLMDALKNISPVPIGFEVIESGAKGYYHVADKRIAIQSGMSELQTLKTALHEISHAVLHADASANISKNRKELEAEGCAAVVLNYMGYDTSEYSFPYLASYSTDDSLKELKASLDTIRKTSGSFIRSIDQKVSELVEQRKVTKEADKENGMHHEGDVTEPVSQGQDDKVSGTYTHDQEAVVAERKPIGYVRILPDGMGGTKPSLLDRLRIDRQRVSNKATDAATKGREVAVK